MNNYPVIIDNYPVDLEEIKMKQEYYDMCRKRHKTVKEQEGGSEQLTEKVEQADVHQEKTEVQQQKALTRVNKPLLTLPEIDIDKCIKYAGYAKTAAKVIDMFADGAIALADSLNKGGNIGRKQTGRFGSKSSSNSKIDISNILQAAEKFVNNLSK